MPSQFDSFNPGDTILDTHVEQYAQPIQDIQSGAAFFSADTGVADEYVVTFNNTTAHKNRLASLSDLNTGLLVTFKAGNANTGAATLEVVGTSGSLGVFDISKRGGMALSAGDIQAGQMVAVLFDEASSRFEMLGGW